MFWINQNQQDLDTLFLRKAGHHQHSTTKTGFIGFIKGDPGVPIQWSHVAVRVVKLNHA